MFWYHTVSSGRWLDIRVMGNAPRSILVSRECCVSASQVTANGSDPRIDGKLNCIVKNKFVESLHGCLETPCDTGFDANDIRVVGNVESLAENRAAAKLLELVEIPLADIAVKNAQMLAGERDLEDIRHHAEERIEANRAQVEV